VTNVTTILSCSAHMYMCMLHTYTTLTSKWWPLKFISQIRTTEPGTGASASIWYCIDSTWFL